MFLLRFLTGLSVGLAVGAFLLALKIISGIARLGTGFFLLIGIPLVILNFIAAGWSGAWKAMFFPGVWLLIFVSIDFVASFIYYRITEPNGPESWK